MDKQKIRVEIHNTIDTHCAPCTKTVAMDVASGEVQRYCMTQCQIGKHLNKLGKALDMRREEINMPAASKIISTKEDYLELKSQGLTNAQIAKKFGISEPTLYQRMKVWGIKSEKKSSEQKQQTPKHPPAFFDYLADQGLKHKADEMRAQAVHTVNGTHPNIPAPQQPADPATHRQDDSEQVAVNKTAEPIYVTFKIPLVLGDNACSYGMHIQNQYKKFGESLDNAAALDRGAVLRETLQLMQAVLSSLQFDVGQIVVDESQRVPTLVKFIEHHNQQHISELLQRATDNGWEVIGNG